MKLSLTTGELASHACDVALVPLFASPEPSRKGRSPPPLEPFAELDRRLEGQLAQAARDEDFSAKPDQTLSLPTVGRIGPKRLILLGLGVRSAYDDEVLRLAIGRGVKLAQKFAPVSIDIALPASLPEDAARAVVEGALLGLYRYDRFQTAPRKRPELKELRLLHNRARTTKLDAALKLGERVATATNRARDLVNEPPNHCTPGALADAARAVARRAGLKCEVLEEKEIEKLRMGLFLGVARGSHEAPALVKLTYTPRGAKAKSAPLALVGKAITFDSGGLSLKPSDSMIEMKTDMAGAAAVLGAMEVIASLAPPFPVHAFMGICENMPGGGSYKLGEVLTSRLGKTVEITNTDAEGRLVLADVLAWANEEKPFALIDLATLTGACMVALGAHIAGAMGSNEALTHEIVGAAESAGEPMWRLPLSELQKDVLKSDIADLKNSGERWGGAINAGLFLKEFVGETPWVHLDIAGPSNATKERGYLAKGATGYGVRTLVEFVRRRVET